MKLQPQFEKLIWLYDKVKDNSARFTLGIPGKNNLFCFGINPSTAEPYSLDNTVTRVQAVANEKGYDGWIMLNIYPQRATNPNDMHNDVNKKLNKENLKFIGKVFKEYKGDIWAAWGTLITKRIYLFDCLTEIVILSGNYKKGWYSIGNLSKEGHPHHPLYLKKNLPMEKFDVVNYAHNLGSSLFFRR